MGFMANCRFLLRQESLDFQQFFQLLATEEPDNSEITTYRPNARNDMFIAFDFFDHGKRQLRKHAEAITKSQGRISLCDRFRRLKK